MPRIVLIFLLVVTSLPQHAAASDTLVINKKADLDSIPLISHASFFEDRSGNMPWQEVMSQTFTPAQKRMFRFVDSSYGRRRVTLWFRVTVQNAMEDSVHILLLFQSYALYKEVIVLSHDDTVRQRPDYFFTPLPKKHRMNVIAPAGPGEQLTYLIRIKNPKENLGPMTIMSVQAYDDWSSRAYRRKYTNYLGHIIFLAVILFITLHTLAQYFMRRRGEFLWYALYSTSLFLIGLDDLERQHHYDILLSFFPYIQNYAIIPLFLFSSYLYLRFARAFVDFKSLAPWFHRVVIWNEKLILAMMAIVLTLDVILNNSKLSRELYTGWRVILFATSFAGIYLMLRSRKKVLYFFGTGTLLLTLGVLLSMVFYYFPHLNPLGRNVNVVYIEIGVVLELFCFTLGLSYKGHLIEVEKQRLQEELNVKLLQLLKSQLNPHFYFNTLNNLYGLAMMAPKKAPDAILKLSDIMEYVIYDCRNDKVELAKEVKFLQSYIELEKLRYDEKVSISMNVTGQSDNRFISPMLLIQFIENAFKHGIEDEKANSYLHISLNMQNGSLIYESHNSINRQKGKNGGIGLTNVKKRLDLLYPAKHDLQVIPGDNEFRVKLQLTL